MSISRKDIEDFFRTLLLGDFEENQNTAAQVVGGLISLIPVLDQVMDVRDVSGALFNINKRGGFKNAGTDQLVNLGFSAFGAVPEVGSAFKTVFKPLWKERRAAKGAINGGLQAVERLLGMNKGGAIRWIREELLGKWALRSQQAIIQVNLALDSCIELCEFMANAQGWKGWLIPDAIQDMARGMVPGLKSLKGGIGGALNRASNEIREFLEDLLGEQAAAVVMAVGQRAAVASAVPGTRTRNGHNAAALTPTGRVPARQPAARVQGQNKTKAKRDGGAISIAMQGTAKAIRALAAQEKGLMGEHIVDHFELKRLGGSWPHDKEQGRWNPASVKKLNVDKRPVMISLQDLPKVNHPGLDAVWEHAGSYTVTEAKASASIGAVFGLGQAKEKRGQIPKTGLGGDALVLHYLLSDNEDKRGVNFPMMQMGAGWVQDRGLKEGLPLAVSNALKVRNKAHFARRVVLVTMTETAGTVEHIEALADVHLGKTAKDIHSHLLHNAFKQWDGVAIDDVERARLKAHESARDAYVEASRSDKGSKPRATKARVKR